MENNAGQNPEQVSSKRKYWERKPSWLGVVSFLVSLTIILETFLSYFVMVKENELRIASGTEGFIDKLGLFDNFSFGISCAVIGLMFGLAGRFIHVDGKHNLTNLGIIINGLIIISFLIVIVSYY